MVSRPSEIGLGDAGLGAAGLASATDGVNSQFGLTSALISSTILGSTSTTSFTSISPTSKGSTDGRTVTALTSTMLGVLAPATVAKFTPVTLTCGTGSKDSDTGPSITRSRPVAFFTSETICGLYWLRSKKAGAISSATISTPITPPAPIRTFLRVEGLMAFPPGSCAKTLAHRLSKRHREIEDCHMADIVNLKRARKDKARREHERGAAANRQRFGRTKAQKAADQDATARSRRSLDDKRLLPGKSDEDP